MQGRDLSHSVRVAPAQIPPRLIGIILMIVAMMVIPIVDTTAKYLTGAHDPLFVAFLRYAAASPLILALSIARRGIVDAFPRTGLVAQAARTALLVCAMGCFFTAIQNAPLADTLGAYFISPIVAAILAVLLLGERLTILRGLGIGLGFAGALFIVQPGASMNPALLYALAAGLLFGGYLVATRATALKAGPLETLTFQCSVGALLLLPFALPHFTVLTTNEWALVATMAVFSLLGHGLSIMAFRFADASTLSPLVYFELVSGAALGFLIFGDVPTPLVWLGMALIVLGGVIVIRR